MLTKDLPEFAGCGQQAVYCSITSWLFVCHGYGSEESSAWKARKQGFEEEIGKYEEIRCISADLKGDPEEARSWLTGVLADGTQIDAVHCSSDHPARGLVQALKEAGMWKKTV